MYIQTKLGNGVRVVCEKIPYVRSVSIGIWVGTGSRDEIRSNSGVSHFIEHMLFKGTGKRTAKEIAETIDSIGGQLNAFTGKECTCFYAKILDSHLVTAVDILSDMFFNSLFDEKDIEIEKKVVLEEIDMYEDSPEELVHDLLSETVWDDDSLGDSILGTEKTINNFNASLLKKHINNFYTTENTVIAVAGNFEYDSLMELINKYFGQWKKKNMENSNRQLPQFACNKKIKEKDTEQIHICIGFEGINHSNENLYDLLAINNIVGGGMSSRLFQKIREEMGLVYSIYSYPSSYKDVGLFTIYAGMNPKHLDTVIELIKDEIASIVKTGITKEETNRSKEQLKGNYTLGLESTSNRMNSMGKSELLLGKIHTPEEILEKIDNITLDSATLVINKIFSLNRFGFAAVGKQE